MSPKIRRAIGNFLKGRAKKLDFKRNLAIADSYASLTQSQDYSRRAQLARVQIIGTDEYARKLDSRAQKADNKSKRFSKRADRLERASARRRQLATKLMAKGLRVEK
ncbi:MAG: hypothetical protein COT15_01730 [Candidatus Diapherotrites archaeon CG08_land_8_20_14_0_20_34_12]|nr:MAG: hypothetical protein COT15_01730 [Candidatus Diapherotrites archaeon CG08_land_8_20_14_0_20_34_12]